jgi:hypothetical protein
MRARVDRRSPLVSALYALALADDDDLGTAIRLFSLVPVRLWANTEAGERALAAVPDLSPESAKVFAGLMRTPAVARGVAALRVRAVAVLRDVLGDGADHQAPRARYAAWVAAGPTAPLNRAVPAQPATHSDGDAVLTEAINAHLARRVGPIARVYPGRDPRWVKLDVHVIPAGDELVLVTSGMAERPLFAADLGGGTQGYYTELVMRLPADWQITEADLADVADRQRAWPVVWLRYLGRMPHRRAMVFRPCETTGPILPWGPARASEFVGALFVASARVRPLALVDRNVEFLAVCPLYPEELALARGRGGGELLARFAARGLDPERVEPNRERLA